MMLRDEELHVLAVQLHHFHGFQRRDRVHAQWFFGARGVEQAVFAKRIARLQTVEANASSHDNDLPGPDEVDSFRLGAGDGDVVAARRTDDAEAKTHVGDGRGRAPRKQQRHPDHVLVDVHRQILLNAPRELANHLVQVMPPPVREAVFVVLQNAPAQFRGDLMLLQILFHVCFQRLVPADGLGTVVDDLRDRAEDDSEQEAADHHVPHAKELLAHCRPRHVAVPHRRHRRVHKVQARDVLAVPWRVGVQLHVNPSV
eukprot:1313224-Rhodomonas_salina.2